ncbi:MAG: tyrosine decarboxylase MfnA [Candidatus Heimdallarchaeota archaeon]|nr:tyrosine decarboxylase MfnA [Candidatus Heimdallarchaeota archaeon]
MPQLKSIEEYKSLVIELEEILRKEKSYDQVLSSMCTPPLKISREIASLYAEINLGDPGLFPKAKKMEKEVLAVLANFLNAPQGWSGTIASGGSESNLIGCWAARNWARKYKNIKNGTIIFPESAHVSFEKAVDILNIDPVWVKVNENQQVDIEKVKENIDDRTIALIGIAGTTGTGTCDDIKALSDLAIDNQLFLHVDAAHGGTIYPFFKDIGLKPPPFGFENYGVKSITIDTHKILGSLIPGGSIIFRDNSISEVISKGISYLSDATTKQLTVTGTRPGSSIISSWILLVKFGRAFIIERVKGCLERTDYLVKRLTEIPEIKLAFKPIINIVGLTSTVFTSNELANKLRELGWHLSIYNDWIRIVVMPHVTREMIDRFILNLKDILKEK